MSDVLAATKEWFNRAVPEPTPTNFGVQLGCHFEEVAEMVDLIAGADVHTAMLILEAKNVLEALSNHLKENPLSVDVLHGDRSEFLDAVCDQLVTATGTAHMLGMDPVGGLNEVNRSNWSKFVDGQPIFDENKKIKKGPNYSRPDLEDFV